MTDVLIDKKKIEVSDWYLQNFKLIEEKQNGNIIHFVQQLRNEAIKQLKELGFPSTKNEEWKYTQVLPIVQKNFLPSSLAEIPKNKINDIRKLIKENPIFSNLSSNQLVFIDGKFCESLSTIESNGELVVSPIRNAFDNYSDLILKHFNKYSRIENGFNALNNAFFSDGLLVYAKDNLVEDEPIVAIFVQSGDEEFLIAPRNLVIIGKNSQIKIIEIYISLTDVQNFSNVITEIFLDENSKVEHYKFQDESLNSYHIGKIQGECNRNANLVSHNLVFGAALSRNDINIVLNGEGAEGHMYGLFFVKDSQHCDNHTLFDHAKPHCISNEFYKGILADNSKGVFNGKIIVRKGAQKTNAYQQNKNLLLSGNARIDTKPQLEIFADDVRCTHGATVGQIEEASLFYLRARGIDEKTARTMLVNAFANDVLMNMTLEPFRDKINDYVINLMNRIFNNINTYGSK